MVAAAFLNGPKNQLVTAERQQRQRSTGLYFEFVLLPVDDDSGDLLVHENEDGAKQGWDHGDDCGPPGVGPQRVDEPAPIVSGWLF